MTFSVNNSKLCEFLWSKSNNDNRSDEQVLIDNISVEYPFSQEQLQQIREKLVKTFLPSFKNQWQSVSRKRCRFVTKYGSYLEKNFTVTFKCSNESAPESEDDTESLQSVDISNAGRKRKSFEESSKRTKRRRISELSSVFTAEELAKALKKKISMSSEELEIGSHQNISNKTLAMYVDSRLSKSKFQNLNIHVERICGSKVFSSYDTLSEAKKQCYPDNIDVSESGAEVHFTSLLIHTVKRILIQLDPILLQEVKNEKIILIGKWGMDGASGQQTTRQKWSNESNIQLSNSYNDNSDDDDDDDSLSDSDCDENPLNNDLIEFEIENHVRSDVRNDATVFIVSFAPLQLKANDRVLWTNETPNSVQTCRTVKFEFTKETDLYVRNLYERFIKMLEENQTHHLKINDSSYVVAFDMKCTMIDGKVCNSLTGQRATNSCNICGVGPKNINNLDYLLKLNYCEEFYKFGLSTLHCKIRCMEYLLKIAYNSDFKKPQARSPEEKILKSEKKRQIQNLLKSKLSLTVDIVKQGAGTTNTGNVARTFFENAKDVADCTGLDENLINRFHNILQVISCNSMINYEAMKKYCEETFKLCISLYKWYKMPPSVHKLLIHGSEIIRSFEIPFGWLSEEPQEGNNKVFRKIRLENSRMNSRKSSNEDIIHNLMISSDVLISSLRIKKKLLSKPLSTEAQELLVIDP